MSTVHPMYPESAYTDTQPTTHTKPRKASATRSRITRAAGRVADMIHHSADLQAQHDGFTVHRYGITGRAYTHPAFTQDARKDTP